MKKKLIVLLLAAVGLAQYAVAANGLWLEKRDGSKIGYLFDQDITIQYNIEHVVLTAGDVAVEYPFDEVQRMYFDDDVTGIAETQISEKQQLIRVVAAGLELKGFDAGTPVMVSDLTGKVSFRRTTNADGVLYISRSDLPRGVCAVKAGKTTIKFNNK